MSESLYAAVRTRRSCSLSTSGTFVNRPDGHGDHAIGQSVHSSRKKSRYGMDSLDETVISRAFRAPGVGGVAAGPLRHTSVLPGWSFCLALLLGLASAQTLYGATPGLPFAEDFSSTTLRDDNQSTAQWGNDEDKLVLAAWKRRFGALQGAAGTGIGTDTDFAEAIALGDMDGDGDLDVVAGNQGQNKLYLNDGDSDPFSGVTAGGGIGNDTDNTYTIAVGDVDGDGDLDVVAGNGFFNSKTNKLYVNNGSTSPFFAFAPGSAIGSDADDTASIALADVDGDGDLDVVVGNDGQSNKLYINDGDSDPFTGVTTGSTIGSADTDSTQSIALGDMEGDGDLDVVAGNDGQNKLYLNDGDSDPFNTLTSGSAIGTDSNDTHSMALGDVDGDGDVDVVAGNDGQNKWHKNDGDSDPFSPGSPGSAIGTSTDFTGSVALGDVDGDGDLDVVNSRTSENRLFPNDGTATPFDGATIGSNIGSDSDVTWSIALGDMDGDGDLDVVAGNRNGQTNKLHRNNAGGNPFYEITSGVSIGTNTDDTQAIALGDVDGDGDVDVVAGNNNLQNRLYLNDGDDDPFSSPANVSDIGTEADSTLSIALGDVDGDGDVDVVAGNASHNKLYLNDGDSDPFSPAAAGGNIGSDSNFTFSIALGDVDGDGDLDVVAGNSLLGDKTNRLYLNDGDSDPFSTVTGGSAIGTEADDTEDIALGDVDGDGDLDVVAGNKGQTNKLYFNDGDNDPFSPAAAGSAIGTESDDTLSLALGDVDGDGDLDVVAGNFSSTNKWYMNDGDNAPFNPATAGTPIGTGNGGQSVALADVDGDGDLDVVFGLFAQNNKLYLNDGDADPFTGLTGGSIVGTVAGSSKAIALGDVDGDGDLDVVAGNSGEINKLYPNGGTPSPFSSPGVGSDIGTDVDSIGTIALGDVDGDGDVDVVAAFFGLTNKLYLNDGGASPFSSLTGGSDIGTDVDNTIPIALGDVDGDGDLDVVAGNDGQTNKLYLNDGDDDPFSPAAAGGNIGSDSDSTSSVALGDVDGDGDLDVVAGNDGQTNKLYFNDGDSDPFSPAAAGGNIGSDSDSTFSIALGDVDGDGDLDVVAGNSLLGDKTNRLYLNDGDSDPFNTITGGSAIGTEADDTEDIALGDVDGDGDLDVVAGNKGQTNKLYFNDGDGNPFDGVPVSGGTFDDDPGPIPFDDASHSCGVTPLIRTINVPDGFTVTDADLGFNADHTFRSDIRVVLESPAGSRVTVIDGVAGDSRANYDLLLDDASVNPLNDGDADTTVAPFYERTAFPDNALSAFNGEDALGDWKVEICDDQGIDSGAYNRSRLILNQGSFKGRDLSTDSDDTLSVALGDVDGDGDLDIIAGNVSAQTNKLYMNDGSGTPFIAPVAGSDVGTDTDDTRSIALGDMDGDGDMDVVTGNDNVTNKLHVNRRAFDTARSRAGSLEVDTEGDSIVGVILNTAETTPHNTAIQYYLSNNDGAKWHLVQPGEAFGFPAAGADLRWRAVLHSLSPALTPELSSLSLAFSAPPTVIQVNSLNDTGDAMVSEAETVEISVTQLLVTFNQNVSDPAGDAAPNDVTNPANYLLFEEGANEVFNTVDCAAGIVADDTQITINTVSYSTAARTATLNLNGAIALGDGGYRLLVCGTTSIENGLGDKLDDGADFARSFSVRDTDGDGIPNGEDPDDDDDGMSDVFENTHVGLDPLNAGDAGGDLDHDGVSNVDEFLISPDMDPNNPDTDGDGIQDNIDDNPPGFSNLCDGVDATLDGATVSDDRQCAAPNSVTIKGATSVTGMGNLEVISPRLHIEPGLTIGGQFRVRSTNPCPACP